MPISSLLSWKDIILSDNARDSSNAFLPKIKAVVGPLIPFVDSFDEISKNQGIAFLSLDPSETQLQLFHHGTILGGSWSSPSKQLVSVLGIDNAAKPIQIVIKSVKDVKQKSFSFQDFESNIGSNEKFENMKNAQVKFSYKNINPIPNILTKVFISLESTDPYSVAKAFFNQMKDPETPDQEDNDDRSTVDIEVNQTTLPDQDTADNLSSENKDDSDPGSERNRSSLDRTSSNPLLEFFHVIQF